MPSTIDCPHCHKQMQVADADIGLEVLCPHCQGRVIMPPSAADPTGAGGPPITHIPAMVAPLTPTIVKRQGLGIAALILGVIGLVGCPPVGLAGLVMGIVVVARTGREPHVDHGKGPAIAGIVTGTLSLLCGIPLIIALLLPMGKQMQESFMVTACQMHIQTVAVATRQYAMQYETMPPDLDTLIDEQLISAEDLSCPNAQHDPRLWSYTLPTGLDADCPADRILLYELQGNHAPDGASVCYCDGRCLFATTEQLPKVFLDGGVDQP